MLFINPWEALHEIRTRRILLICPATMAWANSAQALTCNLTVPPIFTSGGKYLVCPAGDGDFPPFPPFTLQILDNNLEPVEGYPFEDLRLEFIDPSPGPSPRASLAFCNPGFVADSSTDANGMTTFSGTPMYACGSVRNPWIQLVVGSGNCGPRISTNIEIVSVDFDCDGMVTAAGDGPAMSLIKTTWAADLNHSPAGGIPMDAHILAQHIYNLLPQPDHGCP